MSSGAGEHKKKSSARARPKIKPSSSSKAAALVKDPAAIPAIRADPRLAFSAAAARLRTASKVDSLPPQLGIESDELAVLLQRIAKRDALTRRKAWEEIAVYISKRESGDNQLLALLRVWPKMFERGAVADLDRHVRLAVCRAHGKLCQRVGRQLATALKHFIGSWLLATFDTTPEVARAAQEALNDTFASEEKIKAVYQLYLPNVISFAEKCLYEAISENTSDARQSTSDEDAEAKYERLISASVEVLCLLVEKTATCGRDVARGATRKIATDNDQSKEALAMAAVDKELQRSTKGKDGNGALNTTAPLEAATTTESDDVLKEAVMRFIHSGTLKSLLSDKSMPHVRESAYRFTAVTIKQYPELMAENLEMISKPLLTFAFRESVASNHASMWGAVLRLSEQCPASFTCVFETTHDLDALLQFLSARGGKQRFGIVVMPQLSYPCLLPLLNFIPKEHALYAKYMDAIISSLRFLAEDASLAFELKEESRHQLDVKVAFKSVAECIMHSCGNENYPEGFTINCISKVLDAIGAIERCEILIAAATEFLSTICKLAPAASIKGVWERADVFLFNLSGSTPGKMAASVSILRALYRKTTLTAFVEATANRLFKCNLTRFDIDTMTELLAFLPALAISLLDLSEDGDDSSSSSLETLFKLRSMDPSFDKFIGAAFNSLVCGGQLKEARYLREYALRRATFANNVKLINRIISECSLSEQTDPVGPCNCPATLADKLSLLNLASIPECEIEDYTQIAIHCLLGKDVVLPGGYAAGVINILADALRLLPATAKLLASSLDFESKVMRLVSYDKDGRMLCSLIACALSGNEFSQGLAQSMLRALYISDERKQPPDFEYLHAADKSQQQLPSFSSGLEYLYACVRERIAGASVKEISELARITALLLSSINSGKPVALYALMMHFIPLDNGRAMMSAISAVNDVSDISILRTLLPPYNNLEEVTTASARNESVNFYIENCAFISALLRNCSKVIFDADTLDLDKIELCLLMALVLVCKRPTKLYGLIEEGSGFFVERACKRTGFESLIRALLGGGDEGPVPNRLANLCIEAKQYEYLELISVYSRELCKHGKLETIENAIVGYCNSESVSLELMAAVLGGMRGYSFSRPATVKAIEGLLAKCHSSPLLEEPGNAALCLFTLQCFACEQMEPDQALKIVQLATKALESMQPAATTTKAPSLSPTDALVIASLYVLIRLAEDERLSIAEVASIVVSLAPAYKQCCKDTCRRARLAAFLIVRLLYICNAWFPLVEEEALQLLIDTVVSEFVSLHYESDEIGQEYRWHLRSLFTALVELGLASLQDLNVTSALSSATISNEQQQQNTDFLTAIVDFEFLHLASKFAPLLEDSAKQEYAEAFVGTLGKLASNEELGATVACYAVFSTILELVYMTRNTQVRAAIINKLREGDLIDVMLSSAFEMVASSRHHPLHKQIDMDVCWDTETIELKDFEPIEETTPMILATHSFQRALEVIPATVREWYHGIKDKQFSTAISTYIINHCSERLATRSLDSIIYSTEIAALLEEHDQLSIRVGSRHAVVQFMVDEAQVELTLRIPAEYPLKAIQVEPKRRVAVTEARWRGWMLGVKTACISKEGTLADAVASFARNVVLHFAGVEGCTICYSVVSATDGRVASKRCKTCKNKFHASCLFKWFRTSNQSTCPLCRNLF